MGLCASSSADVPPPIVAIERNPSYSKPSGEGEGNTEAVAGTGKDSKQKDTAVAANPIYKDEEEKKKVAKQRLAAHLSGRLKSAEADLDEARRSLKADQLDTTKRDITDEVSASLVAVASDPALAVSEGVQECSRLWAP